LAAASIRGLLFGLVDLGHAHRKGDVLAHRHMRVERVGLEHHGQAALGGRHVGRVGAVDLDLPAGDVLQPRDQAQQRGLAAARGPTKTTNSPSSISGPAAE
jgi:hypothetical protein